MMLLLDVIYWLGLAVGWPFLVVKSLRTGKYRAGLAGRMGRGEVALAERGAGVKVVMVHCVSVGELLSVQTLVGRLLAADSELHVVISTGTDTGTARAWALFPAEAGDPKHHPRVHLVRYPLDFSWMVKRVLDRVRPDGIVLVELETWPNFLAEARRRGIPVMIVNGRISERSYPRYRMIGPVMRGMLRKVEWVGAQTEGIAERFRRLGAREVEVIPTLKYDNARVEEPTGASAPLGEALRGAMGLAEEHLLFVAGSTGPGEEAAVLDAYMGLRGKYAGLRLAIVPRHPEVVRQVVGAIRARGLRAVMRTERPDAKSEIRNPKHEMTGDEVFVLDTMGELRKMYGLAFCVFVGRSLVKMGGSDMIEVAAMGKACCFGPYTGNFAEVVELLLREKTAVVVRDGGELMRVVEGWLEDPEGAREMGRRAREVIAGQGGSTERYVRKILEMVRGG